LFNINLWGPWWHSNRAVHGQSFRAQREGRTFGKISSIFGIIAPPDASLLRGEIRGAAGFFRIAA